MSILLLYPTITCVLKFGTCTRNGSLRAFFWKHSQGSLGVKYYNVVGRIQGMVFQILRGMN